MGSYTSNYNFFKPTFADLMSNVKLNITDTFKTIEPIADVPVIAAGQPLPQVGNFKIGDPVFRNDPYGTDNQWPSIYLLIVKDVNWGWHWRPIQQILSPWVDIPQSAIKHANFAVHPTQKPAIAMDSRGWCHWRGCIRKTTPNIPTDTIEVLKEMPLGLRPNMRQSVPVPITPVVNGGAGISGYVGAYWLTADPKVSGINTFVFSGTNNATSQEIRFDGISYNNSHHWYYGA